MVFYCILWYIVVFYGILWYFIVFYGILLYFMVFCCILCYFLMYFLRILGARKKKEHPSDSSPCTPTRQGQRCDGSWVGWPTTPVLTSTDFEWEMDGRYPRMHGFTLCSNNTQISGSLPVFGESASMTWLAWRTHLFSTEYFDTLMLLANAACKLLANISDEGRPSVSADEKRILNIHTFIHSFNNVYIHIFIHTFIHSYIHTYIHT